MISIFENTKESVTVHILHDDTLTDDNRKKFLQTAQSYNQCVEFHNVETSIADKIAQIKKDLPNVLHSRYTIASVYLLLAAEIVDIEKTIYLDADIIVNRDIADLWNFDLEDYPLAAVPELAIDKLVSGNNYLFDVNLVKRENYFNSGVLLLNLKYLRNNFETLYKGYKFVCSHPQCTLFDQDILNICFSENYLKLPKDFNCIIIIERFIRHNNQLQKAIYHYVINSAQLDTTDVYNRLWLGYFIKTTWFNVDTFGQVFNSVRQMYNDKQRQLIYLINTLSKRHRAFFIELDEFSAVEEIFQVTKAEEVIYTNLQKFDSFNELIQSMTISSNEKIYFIFVGNYAPIRDALIKKGFIEGVNFINGVTFLTEQYGNIFDSHFIISNM